MEKNNKNIMHWYIPVFIDRRSETLKENEFIDDLLGQNMFNRIKALNRVGEKIDDSIGDISNSIGTVFIEDFSDIHIKIIDIAVVNIVLIDLMFFSEDDIEDIISPTIIYRIFRGKYVNDKKICSFLAEKIQSIFKLLNINADTTKLEEQIGIHEGITYYEAKDNTNQRSDILLQKCVLKKIISMKLNKCLYNNMIKVNIDKDNYDFSLELIKMKRLYVGYNLINTNKKLITDGAYTDTEKVKDDYNYYDNIVHIDESIKYYNENIDLFEKLINLQNNNKNVLLADTLNTIQIASIGLTICGWLLVIIQGDLPNKTSLYIACIIVCSIIGVGIAIFIKSLLGKSGINNKYQIYKEPEISTIKD